jgi:hypothetical protein
MLTTSKRLDEKELTKQQKANLITTWSSLVVKKVGDRFHDNFKACL